MFQGQRVNFCGGLRAKRCEILEHHRIHLPTTNIYTIKRRKLVVAESPSNFFYQISITSPPVFQQTYPKITCDVVELVDTLVSINKHQT